MAKESIEKDNFIIMLLNKAAYWREIAKNLKDKELLAAQAREAFFKQYREECKRLTLQEIKFHLNTKVEEYSSLIAQNSFNEDQQDLTELRTYFELSEKFFNTANVETDEDELKNKSQSDAVFSSQINSKPPSSSEEPFESTNNQSFVTELSDHYLHDSLEIDSQLQQSTNHNPIFFTEKEELLKLIYMVVNLKNDNAYSYSLEPNKSPARYYGIMAYIFSQLTSQNLPTLDEIFNYAITLNNDENKAWKIVDAYVIFLHTLSKHTQSKSKLSENHLPRLPYNAQQIQALVKGINQKIDDSQPLLTVNGLAKIKNVLSEVGQEKQKFLLNIERIKKEWEALVQELTTLNVAEETSNCTKIASAFAQLYAKLSDTKLAYGDMRNTDINSFLGTRLPFVQQRPGLDILENLNQEFILYQAKLDAIKKIKNNFEAIERWESLAQELTTLSVEAEAISNCTKIAEAFRQLSSKKLKDGDLLNEEINSFLEANLPFIQQRPGLDILENLNQEFISYVAKLNAIKNTNQNIQRFDKYKPWFINQNRNNHTEHLTISLHIKSLEKVRENYDVNIYKNNFIKLSTEEIKFPLIPQIKERLTQLKELLQRKDVLREERYAIQITVANIEKLLQKTSDISSIYVFNFLYMQALAPLRSEKLMQRKKLLIKNASDMADELPTIKEKIKTEEKKRPQPVGNGSSVGASINSIPSDFSPAITAKLEEIDKLQENIKEIGRPAVGESIEMHVAHKTCIELKLQYLEKLKNAEKTEYENDGKTVKKYGLDFKRDPFLKHWAGRITQFVVFMGSGAVNAVTLGTFKWVKNCYEESKRRTFDDHSTTTARIRNLFTQKIDDDEALTPSHHQYPVYGR